MARRKEKDVPSFPQPPWTYAPAEVDEWIRGTYPSKKRPHKEVRKGSETIARIGFSAQGADADEVRSSLREALRSIGVAMADDEPSGPASRRHRAVASVRRALFGSKVHVSVTFEPPIHPSSRTKLMQGLSRTLEIEDVEEKEERPRLPPSTDRKAGTDRRD